MRRAQVADEYGALCQELAAIKPKIARHKKLAAEIKSWFDEHPADFADTVNGIKWQIEVSERGWDRTIDAVKLFKQVGKDKFIQVSKPLLGEVDKVIPIALHGSFLVKSQTGPRTLEPHLSNVVSITSKKAA